MPRSHRKATSLRSILLVLIPLGLLAFLLTVLQTDTVEARSSVARTGAVQEGSVVSVGSITGTVLMHNGSVPAFARVNACLASVGSGCPAPFGTVSGEYEAYVDSNGYYELSGLPVGAYKILFEGDTQKVRRNPYYNASATYEEATSVNVAAGATTGNINGTMIGYSSISGKVTNAQGAGIPGVEVVVCVPENTGACQAPTWAGGVTATITDGTYLLSTLDAGTYKLLFRHPDYLTEYTGNSYDFTTAQTVTVPIEGSLTGVNASLARAASATGRVVDEAGDPIMDVRVTFEPDDGAFPTIRTTDATGAYTVTTIAAGRYKIKFVHMPSEESWRSHETTYTLAVGANLLPEQTLIAGRSIGGRITVSGGGAPVPSVRVAACLSTTDCTNSQGFETYFDDTDGNGDYQLTGMEPGEYYLILNTNNGSYLGQLYPQVTGFQQGSTIYLDGAELIDLTTAITATINAHLDTPASISGKVTAQSSGAAIAGITISGCRVTNTGCIQFVPATSDANGEYAFTYLAPGTYRLRFSDNRPAAIYADFQPTSITIQAGQHETQNAALAIAPTPTPTPSGTPVPTATPSVTPTPTASPTPPLTEVATLVILPNTAAETTIDEDKGLKPGQSIHLEFPAGAVDEPTVLTFGILTLTSAPDSVSKFVFSITATQGGSPASGLHFNVPVTLTITYRDDDIIGIAESKLTLRYLDPDNDRWQTDGIELVSHDPATNRIVLRIHHLTIFALADSTERVLLPVVGGKP